MCKKTKYKIPNPRIDKCMKEFIRALSQIISSDYKIVACCCGHKKYPISVVLKHEEGYTFELRSNKEVPKKRNFYKRDKQGYYYIPETLK